MGDRTVRAAGEWTRLEARLREIFREELHLEVPSPETDVLETGMVDSLSLVRLLVHLEEEFGIEIEAEDLDLDVFRTVRGMARFVGGRLEAA